MTQKLHTAVWSSYLPPQGFKVLPKNPHPDRPMTRDEVVQNLASASDKIPRPLLGIAVWNLLPTYGRDKDPPADYKNLLGEVLDLDVDSARRIRLAQPSVFPPYPDQLLLGASWVSGQQTDSKATLELCVQGKFEELRKIVQPKSWKACGYFWSSVGRSKARFHRPRGQSSEKINAKLSLPGGEQKAPQPVTLQVHTVWDEMEARVGFTMIRNYRRNVNERLQGVRGSMRVRKEPGRPDATRVTKQIIVRFAPGLLDKFRRQTLDYWLQAEAVHLALETATKGGRR